MSGETPNSFCFRRAIKGTAALNGVTVTSDPVGPIADENDTVASVTVTGDTSVAKGGSAIYNHHSCCAGRQPAKKM
jgi:hypothetical protein